MCFYGYYCMHGLGVRINVCVLKGCLNDDIRFFIFVWYTVLGFFFWGQRERKDT